MNNVAAIRGTLPDKKLKALTPDLQNWARLAKDELAKPSDDRFSSDPELMRQSVEEQLGLKLTPAKRTLETLIVERAAEFELPFNDPSGTQRSQR